MTGLLDILKNVGKGTGLDGIPPNITPLFPSSLCEIILRLLQTIFNEDAYPKEWQMQLLLSIPKKNHTISSPQLRGIAISSLLPRIYDGLINVRFKEWYTPNKEQAGFRKHQGCSLQLFYVILLLQMANRRKSELFLLLIDYEKAFDYANRATIIIDALNKGIGAKFANAIANMYSESSYIPKVEHNYLGPAITTHSGVTQGRKSSVDLFSFLISEMAIPIQANKNEDFVEPHNLAQLADDTALVTEHEKSLASKYQSLMDFSDEKYQIINQDKTMYIHMSKYPTSKPILCKNGVSIQSLETGKSTSYIGMHIKHTNSLKELITFNLDKRMYNVAKFKVWLEVNENTPFPVKLLVLESGALSAILYGSETWGDLSTVSKKLLTIDLTLLKYALGAKQSTTNDLVYQEIKRGDVLSKIQDRQAKFISKINSLSEAEAVVKCIWNRVQHLKIADYYNSLTNKNVENNKSSRLERLGNSIRSMDIRYKEIIGLNSENCLYTSYVNDSQRKIITRWRMSNHRLAIETGRYKRPIVDRERRVCKVCLVIEDEVHVIYNCPVYDNVRMEYANLITSKPTIKSILNPKTTDELITTAKFLKEIEIIHEKYFRLT